MSLSNEITAVEAVGRCAACQSADLQIVAKFPDLPITGRFGSEPMGLKPPGVDQQLNWCGACGHGQLGFHVAPEILYASSYGFRTSNSATARRGTLFFLETLGELVGDRSFTSALDVGCNDLFLLEGLTDRADRRVGVDPIWAGREGETTSGIEVIGATVEDALSQSTLGISPDLIALRHTIEHIDRPADMMRSLVEVSADDAIFLIETPGFDALVRRNRFDHVFHQHVQYFTVDSLIELMADAGAEYVGHRENYHDWGAIAVAFRKTGSGAARRTPKPPAWTLSDIQQKYGSFQQDMKLSARTMESLADDGPVYGYGAANMLPVIAYHLGTDLSFFDSILDDDPAKDEMHYWNLPLQIHLSSYATDLAEASVVVAAVDNVQPIMRRLLEVRPRHIVYPLSII
jgi:hypothetical protein